MRKTNTLFAIIISMIAFANQSFSQCPVTTGLNATAANQTTETMTWNAVAGATSYKLEVEDAQGNNVPFHFETNVNGTSYTLSGLTAGANYKFKVRTQCGGNHPNWSAFFSFTTGGGTGGNCTVAPSGTAVTNITSTGARLNWNSTGSPSYRVRVEDASGNNVDLNFTASTTNTFYNMTGLNSSSNYKFKVRSLCGGSNTGLWSAWTFFTTAALRIESMTTSVSDDGLVIYPNPVKDEISLQLNEKMAAEKADMAIYDLSGKQVFKTALHNTSDIQKVSVTDLKPGMYSVIISSPGNTITKRLNVVK
ncbi:MAG: fibronectin type III domain-containing protein [Bacteroidota bacterium]